jgi:type I site-specific restriction endonuclease
VAELRQYQQEVVDGLRTVVGSSGKRAPLLQMATGLD